MTVSWLRSLDRLLFPAACRHCGSGFEEGLSNILCRACFDAIVPDPDPRCLLCARPLPPAAFEDSTDLRCAECRERKSALDALRCYAPYDGALRLAHHSFKFEGMPRLGPVLGRRMASIVPARWIHPIPGVVPVPLSPDRERERGYHPARILATEVACSGGWRIESCLEKIRPTPPQMSLNREERLKNLKGAFRVKAGAVPPLRIILVDDVTTTGTTLEECARTLRMAGAREIFGLVLGRTPMLADLR